MGSKRFKSSSISDRLFDLFAYAFTAFILIITLYPFLHVAAVSLNDSIDTVRGGITIYPREFTLRDYEVIFSYEHLGTGFRNSTLRTLIGTALGVISSSMIAYTLSRRDFQGRRFISVFLALTMYVSGGLIPFFLLIRELNLINTFAVYILPGVVSAFNVFIIRSFIDGLPFALQESAKIDGANDFTIYWRIILPLTKPALATIALFVAVGHWNSWFDTYLFNSQAPHLTTLQYELMKVLQSTQSNVDFRSRNMTEVMAQISPESIRMAITMVVTLPILFVYPFLQRYFVKGMTLGAVKT